MPAVRGGKVLGNSWTNIGLCLQTVPSWSVCWWDRRVVRAPRPGTVLVVAVCVLKPWNQVSHSPHFKLFRIFTVLNCIIAKILFYFKKLDGLSLESFIVQLSIVKFLISSSLVWTLISGVEQPQKGTNESQKMTQESIRRSWAKSECFLMFINTDTKSYV